VAYAAAVGVFCIHALLLPRLEPLRMAPRIGKAIARQAQSGDMVASAGYDKPSLYFYGKRPVVRARDEQSLRDFLSLPGGRFVVASSARFDRIPADLKSRLKVIEQGLDVLDTNEVVLVAERVEE